MYDRSRDSSGGTEKEYGLDGRGSIPGRDYSPLHNVETDCGTRSASYPMGTGGFFSWGKVTEAWSCPLTSV
jgi:hypothetical protein